MQFYQDGHEITIREYAKIVKQRTLIKGYDVAEVNAWMITMGLSEESRELLEDLTGVEILTDSDF